MTDYTVNDLKVAEQCAIGCALVSADAWDVLAEELQATHFQYVINRKIFIAMKAVAAKQILIDVLTVSDELQDEAETLPYLVELHKNTGAASNVKQYCKMIKDRIVLRDVEKVCEEVIQIARESKGEDVKQVLDLIDSRFTSVVNGYQASKEPQLIKESLAQVIDMIEKNYTRGGGLAGLSSGFTEVDKMTCGFKPGELILIAGRPGMGKTAFGMSIAENIAVRDKKPVLVFSLEMDTDSLLLRLMSSVGGIDISDLLSGRLTDDTWLKLTQTIPIINKPKLFIDDQGGVSLLDVRSKARRMIKKHPDLALIVIDYLQLMSSDRRVENRNEEISIISRGLKSLAKELKIPIIALAQLNRALETRTIKRPIMSDLRESGSLEQDADLIMFVYRDELYDEHTDWRGTAEIIIGKQRNGPTGTIRLNFRGNLCKFSNYIV